MWQQLLFAGLVFCFLLLAACSDENKESSSPTPEPDEPSIVIPDTEDTAPVLEQQGGTATVSFTAAADWTAEATAVTRALDWVSVQPTSGTAGDVTLTITTQPNDTYDERNAAIVLTCAGERTTFTVSQKQKDALLLSSDKVELDAVGGDFTLTLQANVQVTYEIEPGTDWLKPADAATKGLTDLSFAFHADENTDDDPRQAVITLSGNGLTETVTVFQAGTAPVLVVGQQEYIVGSAGETIAVELQSNTAYKVQLPAVDWIAEVDTRSVSAYTLYYAIAPNDTYDARSAEIIFTTADGTLSDTVWITQVQQDAILLAQREYAFPADGGTLRFSVQANVQPEVVCEADWLHPVETRGLKEHAFAYTVDENTGYDARRADLIVRNADNPALADTLTVVQAYREALIVAQREYDISAAGGTLDFYVQTNATLEAISSADWLTRLPDTRALRDEVLHFAVAANSGYDAREATVIIRSTTDPSCADTVRVCQGYQGAIIVAQREYDVSGTGGTLDFTVQTNVEVTASADVDWITQSPGTRGLVEKNLCFDIAPNEGTEARQGTITLSGGGVTQTITVRQGLYKEPKLVDVKYRRSWTWEEAHDNLPLLYYACVERDRYYDNGDVVTDRFVDTGHIISLLATKEYTEGSDEMGFGYEFIRGGCTRLLNNDSVDIVTTYDIVPSLNAITVHRELTDHLQHDDHPKPGNWDEYSVSKLYDESLNIPEAEAIEDEWERCSLPSGWYFWGIFYYMGQRDIDYSYYYFVPQVDNETLINCFSWQKWTHDQFLVIDGRRIDFLDYYGYDENLQVNVTEEDISNPVAKVVTYEGKIEYLGRNFSATMIDTIYEQQYDLDEIYYFRGGNSWTGVINPEDWNWWLGTVREGGAGEPIEIEASQQPIVTTDADWIHIDAVEQGAKSPLSPVQLNVCTWTVKWSVSPNTTSPVRNGYIYFKNKKGEVLRKAYVEQQSADYETLLLGTFEFDGEGWTPDLESHRGGSLAWYSEGTLVYHKNKVLENTTHRVEAWDGLEWEETDDDIIFHIKPHLNNDSQCLNIHVENENVDAPLVDLGVCQDVLVNMQEFVGNFEFQGEGYSHNENEAKLEWYASGTLVYHKKWLHGITPTYRVEIDSQWTDLQWRETEDAFYFNITPNTSVDPRSGKIHLSFEDVSIYLSIIQDPDYD